MDKINIISLLKLCTGPADTFHENLEIWGLVPREGDYKCPKCSSTLRLDKSSDSIDNLKWICDGMVSSTNDEDRRPCGEQISYRAGTFFERFDLSFFQILTFIDLWISNLSMEIISKQLKIDEEYAAKSASFCCGVLLDAMFTVSEKIGGHGVTVEIDESRLDFQQNGGEVQIESQWVFGGYERETGRVFMVAVDDTGADSMLPILQEWILPGTTIVSDFCKAFNCLYREEYINLKEDNGLTFKEFRIGTRKNGIESTWRAAKAITAGTGSKKCIPDNLARYMFFKRCQQLKLCRTAEFYKLAGRLFSPVDINERRVNANAEQEYIGYDIFSGQNV